MNELQQEKNQTLAFAAALTAMLALAWGLSLVLSQILLSGPIALPNSGLSVQIPEGRNWRTTGSWQYQDNTYSLTSLYTPRNNPVAMATARYVLAANGQTSRQRIGNRAEQDNLEIIREGTSRRQIEFDWAIMRAPEPSHVILLASARLEHGRVLEIEIQDTTANLSRLQRVFNAVAANLTIEPNEALAAGIDLVEKISQNGLSRYIDPEGSAWQFLITDQNGQVAGFSSDFAHVPQQDDKVTIESSSLVYIAGRMETFLSLESTDNMREFISRAQMAQAGQSDAVNLIFQNDRLAMLQRSKPDQTVELYPGKAMLLTVPMTLASEAIIRHEPSEFVIDTLTSRGMLIPVLVSVERDIEHAQASHRVTFMTDSNRVTQQWLLDDNYDIIQSTVVDQGTTLIWKKTDTQTIKELFPEMSEYILTSR